MKNNGLLIYPGRRYQKGGVAYLIKKLLPNSVAEVVNLGIQRTEQIGYEEILRLWASGELEFEVTGRAAKAPEEGNLISTRNKVVDFSMVPEENRELAKIRCEAARHLLKMAPSDRTDDFMRNYSKELFEQSIKGLPEKEIEALRRKREKGDPLPQNYAFSPRSLYRFMEDFVNSGGNTRSLLSEKEDRGGKGGTRLEEEPESLVQEVIDQEYLTPQRKSVAEVHQCLTDRIQEKNAEFKAAKQYDKVIVHVPHKSTIYRRIKALDPFEVMAARYGRDIAEEHYRTTGPGISADLPMERVEIDHSLLNFILVDDKDRLPVGRATTTNTICVKTKVLPGIHVGFDPEGYGPVCNCLYHTIPPKLDTKAKYGTQHEWLGYGIPQTLVVDNGLEFKGTSLDDAAQQIVFSIEPNDAYEPRQKPHIERFF